jgi:hypothetical protein
MKVKLTLILLIIVIALSNLKVTSQGYISEDFITTDVIARTFCINYKDTTGTTFLVKIDSTNYFVTAKHIIKSAKNKDTIRFSIRKDSTWIAMKGIVMVSSNQNIDVAVIKPTNLGGIYYGIDIASFDLIIGDEGFFIGFPFNMSTYDLGRINDGFPIPIVKKLVLSGFLNDNGATIYLFDGNNNPGFSGAPILFRDRKNKAQYKYYLIAIVSGYRNQASLISTPIGTIVFNENSGIIIAYGAEVIEEIIDENKRN